ncbi:DNA-binding response regulator [Paenibacillus sp. PK3_47]|uniref:response regulator transcription factor n=1 Tax=Paenibacillus sp. PK3_47 TaxID=2072642 RepID=UPI00201D44A5|nr:response regulator [Paenibacillus sp. PK3_47]UQZ34011.1 DNA-binding response regulator [Paenibacillus sp. PK3_47]
MEYTLNSAESIKICIVDDIPAVVRGLSQRIPWDEHGIVVAGTAANGEEGLMQIRRHRPDIVLTDIRMPFTDGLEMMRIILAEQPDIKLIFLTGYSDFSYAQEALKLGAFDLIVKPFTKCQVLESVLKAKEVLERERSQAEQMRGMEQKLRESMPYLRQEYMRLLIRYGTRQQHRSQQWDFYNIRMNSRNFCVMVAEIDFFAERTAALPVSEVELIRFAVHNILEETVAGYTQGIVFREHINQFVIVMNPPAELDAEQLAERCRENVRKHTYQTVSIGLGGQVEEAGQLAVSYAQALSALANTFLTGGNSVYRYIEGTEGDAALPRYSYDKEKELLYCLRSANLAKAEEQLDDIWNEWLSTPVLPDPSLVKTLCLELAHSIHRVFSDKAADSEVKLLEKKLADMNSALSFEELRRQIREFCRQGCAYVQIRQSSESRVLVERAVAHIQGNLHRNLSVADIAREVHLSPSYFSNLFKKEMGMTLAQYIISRRMEKAKELVLEGMQVQDIAISLGYEDRPYFTELFKRYTGMTPTDFRAKYTTESPAGKQ